MEDLIKRLQYEVGLTEEEAIKTLSIVKDHMDKEGLKIDWNKYFKEKSEEFLGKTKSAFNDASKQSRSYTDKIVEKVDDLADKARKSAHDLSQKAADFFDEK